MKKIFAALAVLLLCLLCACSNRTEGTFLDIDSLPDDADTPAPSASPRPSATPFLVSGEPETEPKESEESEDPGREGMAPSLLTGEYVDEEIANRRPIAVVINNLDVALPQSGISQAGLYYEILSEGVITRIIAVFQGADSAKIGPIRSARDYFIRFALDNGAIFAHHGGSESAKAQLASMSIDNLDGLKLDGSYYWRDPVRVAQKGMYEHSSYSNSANLLEAAQRAGYDTLAKEGAAPLFSYYDGRKNAEEARAARTIRVPFSSWQNAYFEYDEETGLYARFEYNASQIDEETGEQLKVNNVIIQFVDMHVIPNDPDGRRAVALVGSGAGWLATNGTYIPIKWSKASDREPTKWFFEDGSEMKLNVGKTWICVLQKGSEPGFE